MPQRVREAHESVVGLAQVIADDDHVAGRFDGQAHVGAVAHDVVRDDHLRAMRPPDRRPLRMPHNVVRHDAVMAPCAAGRRVVCRVLSPTPPLDAAPRILGVDENVAVDHEVVDAVQFDDRGRDRLGRHMQLLPLVRTAAVDQVAVIVLGRRHRILAGPQDAVCEGVHAVDRDVVAFRARRAQQVAQMQQILIGAESDTADAHPAAVRDREAGREIRIRGRVEKDDAVVADAHDARMLGDDDRVGDQPCARRHDDGAARVVGDAFADRGRVVGHAVADRAIRAHVHRLPDLPMEELQGIIGSGRLVDPVGDGLVGRDCAHAGEALLAGLATQALRAAGAGEDTFDEVDYLLHVISLIAECPVSPAQRAPLVRAGMLGRDLPLPAASSVPRTCGECP